MVTAHTFWLPCVAGLLEQGACGQKSCTSLLNGCGACCYTSGVDVYYLIALVAPVRLWHFGPLRCAHVSSNQARLCIDAYSLVLAAVHAHDDVTSCRLQQ